MTTRITGIIVSNEVKWIYDLYDIDSFAPNDIHEVLDSVDPYETIDIEINSPGGFVYAGNEIYTALLMHKGDVNITITGLAASMASVIAMAGTKVSMSPVAELMIHNVSGTADGDYRDHAKYADKLKKNNDELSNAYMLKTGLSKEKLLSLMDDETFLTADEALELGFIDEILTDKARDEFQLVASYKPNILPDEVIKKALVALEIEKINLLKIKGM